jgi:hypothetical protein
MDDQRERAWDEIHELLPAGWRVPTRASRDDASRRWQVTAIGPKVGGRRGPPPECLTVDGLEELTALIELVLKLRELGRAGRMAELERRARVAYVAGAEEHSRRVLGRPLTTDETKRIAERFDKVG